MSHYNEGPIIKDSTEVKYHYDYDKRIDEQNWYLVLLGFVLFYFAI